MSSSAPRVYFFYEVPVSLRNRSLLKQFIQSIFKSEEYRLRQLNYIFCSDKRVLEINRQFLQHDYYTDIITFELSGHKEPVEGEVYISIDRVKDNAKALDEPINRELLRVIFHGALHLCGYRDKTRAEMLKIRQKEDFYIAHYFQQRDKIIP
jgi:probable rRNA maturation factor